MTQTLNLLHYDTYITAHILGLIQYQTCLSLSKQIYLNTWNLMIIIGHKDKIEITRVVYINDVSPWKNQKNEPFLY